MTEPLADLVDRLLRRSRARRSQLERLSAHVPKDTCDWLSRVSDEMNMHRAEVVRAALEAFREQAETLPPER